MNTSIADYYAHYDWFGFAVQIIVTTILYFVLRAYGRMSKQMQRNAEILRIQNEIIKQRGFNLYLIATASVEYFKVPGLPVRTKDGDYYNYLEKEKKLMRDKLLKSESYKNVPVGEVDAIIENLYSEFN